MQYCPDFFYSPFCSIISLYSLFSPRGYYKIKNNQIFTIVKEINEALALTNEPEKLVNAALDMLAQTLNVECCWIQTAGEGKDKRLVLAAERGFNNDIKAEITAMTMNHDFGGRVIGMGEKIVIPDLNNDGLYGLGSFRKAGYRWLVAAPLMTYRVYGILGAASNNRKTLHKETAELVMVIAGLIANSLCKANLSHGFPGVKKQSGSPARKPRTETPPPDVTGEVKPEVAPHSLTPPTKSPPKPAETAFHTHKNKMRTFRKSHN